MISKLVPVCSVGQTVLVGLSGDDHDNPQVKDALVVKVSLPTKSPDEPWSIQKLLKFGGFYEPIPIQERSSCWQRIEQQLDCETLSWIADALMNPSQKSVDSLTWVPDRLKNKTHLEKYQHPVYSMDEYIQLRNIHGGHGSWAIWNEANPSDTNVIDAHRKELHCRYVLVGLNISRVLSNDPWRNFHGGKHDRKLTKSCNMTILRGSYMTDLFKGVNTVSSTEFSNKLAKGLIDTDGQVKLFEDEMKDIKLTPESVFLIFGELAFHYYNEYFRDFFINKVIKCNHYSDFRRKDDVWVSGFLAKIGINPGEYFNI